MSTTPFPKAPILSPCNSTVPPTLPSKFHSVVLLTPFNNTQLVVAELTYDWSIQAMRVTAYGLEGGYGDFLYTPDGFYILDSVNGGAPKNIFGPIATTEQVCAPNWLSNYKVTCNCVEEVLGINVNWWCSITNNTNPPAPIPPDPAPHASANWFWMRTDNQYPWRMMFINTTNEYKLPFIGRFAFIHFPTFEAVANTNLPALILSCKSQNARIEQKFAESLKINNAEDTYNLLGDKPFLTNVVNRAEALNKIQNLIPGLTPPNNNPLPAWPARLFMTALTTPTFEPHPFPNQPYPTEIYYDSTIQRQLTRFILPDDSLEDVILTDSISYLIARFPNGTHKCIGNVPVGLPYTNWPTRDGGICKGVIKNNPQLSPNKTTQIFTLNSMPPRVFWIWYTTTDAAIMFAEVPQACNVELILTDYFDTIPNPPPFDPSLFVVPSDCMALPLQAATKLSASKPAKKAATSKLPKKISVRKLVKKAKKALASKSAKRKSIRKVVKKTAARKMPKKAASSKAAKQTVSRKVVKRAVVRKPAKKISASKAP